MSAAIAVPLVAAIPAVAALIRWYIRDRRKSNAESKVAEHTIDSHIDLQDQSARDARLLYIQRQVDMERQFHIQQIADRDSEILRQRTELMRRDERIAALLEQVGRLETQLTDMAEQMTSVRSQLNDLARHDLPERP